MAAGKVSKKLHYKAKRAKKKNKINAKQSLCVYLLVSSIYFHPKGTKIKDILRIASRKNILGAH